MRAAQRQTRTLHANLSSSSSLFESRKLCYLVQSVKNVVNLQQGCCIQRLTLRLRDSEMLEEEHTLDFYWHKTWKCSYTVSTARHTFGILTSFRFRTVLHVSHWTDQLILSISASFKIKRGLGKNFIFYNRW